MTTAEETLKQSFRTVGKEYGYDNVDAEFVAYKDFKVVWQRSYKCADFKVSDYMYDASRSVMDSLARTLFTKISGEPLKPYTEEMCDWILSDDFVIEKQPVYLRRSRNITKEEKGNHKSLKESFARLVKSGLVDDDDKIFLSWTTDSIIRKAGYCSSVMKVIVISSILDDKEIPDYVIDYALYHEYLVMTEGKKNFGKEATLDLLTKERMFPDYKNAESWLSRLGTYLS